MRRKGVIGNILIIIFLICFGFIFWFLQSVDSATGEQIKDNYYWINNYNITVTVDENRSCEIVEEIEVEFDKPAAGITRMIPIKNYMYRADGSIDYLKAKLSDFKIIANGALENQIYDDYTNSQYYVFELGYSIKQKQQIHNYKFSYNYELGSDENMSYDEFYFNIIGADWDCEINNVNFSVFLPKEFDYDLSRNLGATYGKAGSTDTLTGYSGGSISAVNQNGGVLVTGSIDYLDAFEALTLRAEMKEGYFVSTFDISPVLYILGGFLVAGLAILVAYLFWRRYGKDYEIVSPVTFYPPIIDMAEMELHFKEIASSKTIIGYIVKLANEGYIKIVETNPKKERFELHKLRAYVGNIALEKQIMENLFAYGDVVETKKMGNYLGKTADYINNIYNNEVSMSRVIERVGIKKSTPLTTFLSFFMVALTILPLLYINMSATFVAVAVFVFIFSMLIFSFMIGPYGKKQYVMNIIMLTLFMLEFLVIQIISGLDFKWWLIMFEVCGIIGVFVSVIIMMNLKRRTKESSELMGEILAFRNFLESVEKDRLETMIEKDPEYYYKVLPYTFILEISDVWIEKLHTFNLPIPSWMVATGDSGESSRVYIRFGSAMNESNMSIMSSYQKILMARMASSVASATSSSSRGGGYGGGGSAGGGAGGGGGRAR